jgi:GNAT superfamily N-acetyltransferase
MGKGSIYGTDADRVVSSYELWMIRDVTMVGEGAKSEFLSAKLKFGCSEDAIPSSLISVWPEFRSKVLEQDKMDKPQTNGFLVRPFRRDDLLGVRRVLEATYGPEAAPPEFYDWWCFGCPDATSGFVVAEANGAIVGVQPMIILPYDDGCKHFKGGLLTGVAVHPEFRRRGIFSALVKACEEEAWRQDVVFLSTMPNERSRPGFLKLAYTDLAQRYLLVRPVRPAQAGARIIPGLGWLIGAAVGGLQNVLKPTHVEAGLSVVVAERPTGEVPKLALQHAAIFPGLRIRRSAEWWHWRFLESPTRRYHLIEARTDEGALVGVGVYTIAWRGHKKISYLVDLVVSSEQALQAIVHRLCENAATEECHAVGVVVSSIPLAKALIRAGLWSVPAWVPIKKFYSVVRFNPACDVPQAWHSLRGWYQTLADWDNI